MAELQGLGSSMEKTCKASDTESIASQPMRSSFRVWSTEERIELSPSRRALEIDVLVHCCFGLGRSSPIVANMTSSEPEYERRTAAQAAWTRPSGETSHCWQHAWIIDSCRLTSSCPSGERGSRFGERPEGRYDGVTSVTSCVQRWRSRPASSRIIDGMLHETQTTRSRASKQQTSLAAWGNKERKKVQGKKYGNKQKRSTD